MRDRTEMYAAYYRAWRDVSNGSDGNVAVMEDLPSDVDLVIIIANDETRAEFWSELPKKIDGLHRKGIKVGRAIFLSALFSDFHKDKELNSSLEPFSNDPSGYAKRAQEIQEKYLEGFGYDALVIDVDRNIIGESLEKALGVFRVLAQSWGVESGSNRMLILDHDILIPSLDFLEDVSALISYLFVDTYGMTIKQVQERWFQVKTLIQPEQFVPGFSFYEEGGEWWGDVKEPYGASKAFELALWEPDKYQTKGGVFCYAIDRDGIKEAFDQLCSTEFKVSTMLKGLLKKSERKDYEESD